LNILWQEQSVCVLSKKVCSPSAAAVPPPQPHYAPLQTDQM
jgi:hypothetical protein